MVTPIQQVFKVLFQGRLSDKGTWIITHLFHRFLHRKQYVIHQQLYTMVMI